MAPSGLPETGGIDLLMFGSTFVSLDNIEGPVFFSAILMVGSMEASTFLTSMFMPCGISVMAGC